MLEVVLVGDDDQLKKTLRSAGGATGKFAKDTEGHGGRAGRAFLAVGKGAAVAGAAVGGGLVIGLKKSIDAFSEHEQIAKQTTAVLKSTKGAANVTAKQVDILATAVSHKSGIDDEAVQASENLLLTFRGVRNEAGKGNKIFTQATNAVADMATAMNHGAVPSMDQLHSSSILVGKALQDPVKGMTALRRVGVSLTDAQQKQVKALVASGHTMEAQKIVLGELRKEFGGSAKAAGDTFAGSLSKAKVELGNMGEAIGAKVVPALTDGLKWLTKFIQGIQDGTGAGGKFRDVTVDVWTVVSGAVSTAVTAIKGFFSDHRADIEATEQAFKNLGEAVRFVFEKVVLPIVQRVLPAIKQIIEGNLKIIGGIVKVFTGILTGDFGKAWDGVKQIFSGATQAVIGQLRAMSAPFRDIAAKLGHALGEGFKSVGDALVDAGEWAVKKIAGAVRGLAEAPYNAGRFVLDKLRDGIKSAAEFLDDAAGWIKDKLTGFIHGIGSGFRDIGSFIVDKIGDGLRGGYNVLVGFVNKIISVINKIPGVDIKPIAKASAEELGGGGDLAGGALSGAKGGSGKPAIGKAAGGPLGGIGNAIKGVAGSLSPGKLIGGLPHPDLPPILGDLGGWLISHVKDFIKDKVKGALGGLLGTHSAKGLDAITALAGNYGLTMTSGYRPGDPGWHGKNRARDYSNGYATEQELAFAKVMAANYGSHLLELIHTPLGFGIKNGQVVPNSFYAAVLPNHYNHVHVAMARGGLTHMPVRALVGERGPEIVDLPAGARVHSNAESRRMGFGGGVNVNVEHMELRRTLDVERWASRTAFKIATA